MLVCLFHKVELDVTYQFTQEDKQNNQIIFKQINFFKAQKKKDVKWLGFLVKLKKNNGSKICGIHT